MPINKKLIHFNTKLNFLSNNGIGTATSPTNGNYGNIPENSIVFIKDTQEIWTHGLFYSLRDIPVWNGTKVMYKNNILPDSGLLYIDELEIIKGEWPFYGVTFKQDNHIYLKNLVEDENNVTINILEDFPPYSFVRYLRTGSNVIKVTEVLSSDSTIQKLFNTLNWVKSDIDGLVYQIHPENGDITPLSHPDLSTQPSILPLRFGKYNIKEVLLPIKHEGGYPRTNEIVENYDSGYMSFLKDDNYVSGNVIEISLFGDGYCTHPTVKSDSNLYYIYPTLPQGEWANLEFALIRYMVPSNNYYYDTYSEPYNNYLATRVLFDDGTYVLKYSTLPNYSVNSGGVSDSGINYGLDDILILIHNNSINPISISGSGHSNVLLMLAQISHDIAYLAVQTGLYEFITHLIVDYYQDSIAIHGI